MYTQANPTNKWSIHQFLFSCSGCLQEDPLPSSWLLLSCGNVSPEATEEQRLQTPNALESENFKLEF